MALHWDATACPDWVRSDNEWPITQALIFLSMPLGYGSITEDNAADVYAAIAVYEALAGPVLVEDGQPTRITPEMVRTRIGLTTNAVTAKSPAANITRIAKERLAESRAEYVRHTEEVQV